MSRSVIYPDDTPAQIGFEMIQRIYIALAVILLGIFLLIVVAPVVSVFYNLPILFLFTAFQSLFLFFTGLISAVLLVTTIIFAKNTSCYKAMQITRYLLISCVVLCVGFSFATANSFRLSSLEDIPAPEKETIRILSWNTDKVVDEKTIIELAQKTRPDIIVLPEEPQPFTSSFDCSFVPTADTEHVGRLCEIGTSLNMNVYFWEQASEQTLFISKKFGDYQPVNLNTPPFAGFFVSPKYLDEDMPDITVVHLQRPEFGIGTSWWQKHWKWAQSSCNTPYSIAVGDFNATNLNMRSDFLGKCKDIASSLGIKSPGTWHSMLPAFWGAAIDHIYIGSAYVPIWYGVLSESYGSGHRPIFAVIKKH